MKALACIVTALALSGCASCGLSSSDNELEGQVKRVVRKTPIVCSDYVEADLSLGVLRNGMGSMSKEDVAFVVVNQLDIESLQIAARTGAIVHVTYNVHRVTVCTPDHFLTSVTVDALPPAAVEQTGPRL